MYYHSDGRVHSAGAEAALFDVELECLDTELVLVEWYVHCFLCGVV